MEAVDHPRRCGENNPIIKRHPLLPGSPPQVRGKRADYRPFGCKLWITPAGAGKTRTLRPSHQKSEDHPRRCGENSLYLTLMLSELGSPPQVRGKLPMTAHKISTTRITPAGAGKTAMRLSLRVTSEDHPRRCGENGGRALPHGRDGGSPPQVRGKRTTVAETTTTEGITPAGAGKTYYLCYYY